MPWGTTLIADRKPDDTHDDALPAELGISDARYVIPRYDLADVPMEQRKVVTLRHRNDALIGGTWSGRYDLDAMAVADSMKPSPGNDMAMVVCDSRDGRWRQVWGYASYLWEQPVVIFGRKVGTIRIGSAGPGARWVGGVTELRDLAGKPADYRTWDGNAKGMMGAGLGPQAEGPTLAELQRAIADDDVLPRILPAYIPNTGGAVCPAAAAEGGSSVGPGLCPGGWSWSYTNTDGELRAWAADRYPPGFLRAAALAFARSLSATRGRGVIAAASSPPTSGASIFASEDLRLPADLLVGMPGHPFGVAPMTNAQGSTEAGPTDQITP